MTVFGDDDDGSDLAGALDHVLCPAAPRKGDYEIGLAFVQHALISYWPRADSVVFPVRHERKFVRSTFASPFVRESVGPGRTALNDILDLAPRVKPIEHAKDELAIVEVASAADEDSHASLHVFPATPVKRP